MEPSAQTLHDFLNTMPAVLYEYAQSQDGSGVLRYISPTTIDILGRPREYFMEGMDHFWEIVHPEDLARFRAEDESTVNESSFSSEIRILWPSGEIRWIRFSSKPAANQKDGTVIWSGCIVDITPLKEAEEEVRTLRGVLPICMHCKKIRDDKGCWNRLEEYISQHADVQFSHGLCDKCLGKHYPE